MKTIKVLVIDDSSLVRQALQSIFNGDPDIEVIANAADPYFAVQKIKQQLPDVITLDIQMPRMDGITFLKKLMKQHPIPVIIISSLAKKDSDIAMKAYEYGAINVIEKPYLGTKEAYLESSERLIEAVKTASVAKLPKPKTGVIKTPYIHEKTTMGVKENSHGLGLSKRLILFGASVGGTEAIANILNKLPGNLPGIVMVQHMPKQFTASYAARLNNLSPIFVKEAEDRDAIKDGCAYLAPGDKHIEVVRENGTFIIRTNEGPVVNRHKPSVDVLFNSATKYGGDRITAVLLTGMGKDGSAGLLELKETGAKTIAQDEESCIVFGMPKEAIKINAAQHIMNLEQIVKEIKKLAI